MTPNWKDAPEWAKWVCQDGWGDWCWYECEPEFMACSYEPDLWYAKEGRTQECFPEVSHEQRMRQSLQHRSALPVIPQPAPERRAKP